MKILFVRPPRYMWPFNSESSSFWQPLGYLSMASVLKENGFDVEILDCLVLKMGWQTLKNSIISKEFDFLCVGDEVASANEAIRLIQYVKKNKKAKIVAGGFFFSYMDKEAFNLGIDYIIKGEGEQALLELLSFYSKKKIKNYCKPYNDIKIKSLSEVRGLIYLDSEKIMYNENTLVNLDKLPLLNYELLPMNLYGKNSKNHKNFSAIEHGRGCSGGCDFCSIWPLMGMGGKPVYRTKSAKKSFEETILLVKKYNREILNWTDGTFNIDPNWSLNYFTLLEKSKIKINHTAWMRADCVIRDEKSGLLKKMVENGLIQVIIGMERLKNCDHEKIGTKNKQYEISLKAFKILKKYKKVYTIASLIYGLPDDNKEDLKNIKKFIYSDIVDFQFILPFTPYPGTKDWETYKHYFSMDDLRTWNLHRPVTGTKYLTRKKLDNWFMGCLISYLYNPNFYKRNFIEKDIRKKQIQNSMSKKLIMGLFQGLKDTLLRKEISLYGKKPKWYED